MTRAELKQSSKDQLRGNWGWAVGLSFVAWAIVYIINDISSYAQYGNDIVYRTVKTIAGGELEETINANPAGGLISIVLNIVIMIIGWGVLYTILQFRDNGDKPNVFKGVFSGFIDGRFPTTFLTSLLVGIFTYLWTCLLVIPGIVKSYSYSMAPYIMRDYYTSGKKPEATEAITASRHLMDGHKAELFLLDLSFIGWGILGVITCGIGFLWITPYYRQTKANFYRNLAGDQFLNNK